MENENSERLRASNIIWNASGDYSFETDVRAYDEDGKADLYLNYIIGAVHKYCDYPRLHAYFEKLGGYIDRGLFEELIWTGLENCAFEKGRPERPVLESLRRQYAKRFLARLASVSQDAGVADSVYYDYILDEVRVAHFRRALGETPKIGGLAASLLSDLEFEGTLDTEGIILRMDKIVTHYFKPGLIPPSRRGRKPSRGAPLLRSARGLYADCTMELSFDRGRRKPKLAALFMRRFAGRKEKSLRRLILDQYGDSMLPEGRTSELEHTLCTGVHSGSRLYFTRGEFSAGSGDAVRRQYEKNRQNYRENLSRNTSSVSRLTSILRNAMLINLEASSLRADAGSLEAAMAWRAVYLDDDRIFIRKIRDEIGDISVDVMLDASASQADRQEIIATQAYIIAESLTRCNIPIRVFSFSSEEHYTIINLFRDYGEAANNGRIFNYRAAGCNRDGLAIRTAVHMIKNTDYEHKILIVLSDGLPNDTQGVPVGRFVCNDYLGAAGVNDAAQEVRKGWLYGISILCVFTGRDANIPDAKKIYGQNLAYIRSQSRFADTVGVLMQSELRNL